MADERLERLARWTPLFILMYFSLQFAIRVGLSSNLETDEAQLVGQMHFALGYGNSRHVVANAGTFSLHFVDPIAILLAWQIPMLSPV